MKGVLADRFSLIQFKEWQLRAIKKNPRGVAMLHTYKLDMAASLQYLAASSGLAVTYEKITPAGRSERASAQNKARMKKRLRDIDEAEGPPDKKKNFGEIYELSSVQH